MQVYPMRANYNDIVGAVGAEKPYQRLPREQTAAEKTAPWNYCQCSGDNDTV